jgi:hypothetical protein
MLALALLPVQARAAHLEKVDQQVEESSSPLEGQGDSTSPCESTAQQTVTVDVFPNEASIEIDSLALVRGTSPSCNATAFNTAQVSVAFAVVPDPGESPGAPVTLCFRAAHDLRASDTGGTTSASASLAGAPDTDPSEIAVTSAGIVHSNGPIAVADGRDAKSFGGPVPAIIGDILEMTLSTKSAAMLQGVGMAEARTHAELIIDLGTCNAPVPAASRTVLLALALALAALGSVTVARRIRQ